MAEPGSVDAEDLAVAGLDWLLGQARPVGDGLVWTGSPDDDRVDPSLYSGGAGIALALLEAHGQLGADAYADAALRAARGLAAVDLHEEHCSLYFGLTGVAVALHSVAAATGDTAAGAAATQVLAAVRSRFDGERWGEFLDLLGGNAGIALGALATGDVDLALLAVSPYAALAEPTPTGVHWQHRRGVESRLHHISHGTLGMAAALAATGAATGRDDLVELGLAGAADVVARDEAGPPGFLVRHSDPQYRPELIEPYSYGWCHGPAGDAQAFRLLAGVTGAAEWRDLADRCWHTVVHSGLPTRLRPGFWDNSGRCCGTAGVLALATDRLAEGDDESAGFAEVLVADLSQRATTDADGARWCNDEHRASPSELPPRTGWAMGSAGIVRELLRYARVTRGGDPAYAVPMPDQVPVADGTG